MVQASTISGQINQLNEKIFALEHQFKSKPVQINSCGSDCYCRKAGNHKVTTSLYHKNCIRMKKYNGSVKKTDIVPPKKISERKDIYQLGKAQVEISLKNSTRASKNPTDIHTKYVNNSEKYKKVVDTGTDPITVVESKKTPKKCWSSVLSENSKTSLHQGASDSAKIPFDPPEKLIPNSTASQFAEKESSKRTVMVRDRGIQCHNGPYVINYPDSVNQMASYSPVMSLQSVLNNLKSFQRKLPDKNGNNGLSNIISAMDLALTRLSQSAPANPTPLEGGMTGYHYFTPVKDGSSSSYVPTSSFESLQETCQKLQNSCLKLEQTCHKLQKEKDHITEKFFEKSRELEGCLKRELEYQVKLNDAQQSAEAMAKKLDRYNKSMEDLSTHVNRLQAENKALEHAEEMKAKLINQLRETIKENEKLNNEVQLMTLEKEKNVVLLDMKEQELNKLKSELRSIGGLVSEKMLETVMAGDSMVMSSHFDISDSQDIVFSSPDGTFKSPSKSWKAVSSIISPDQTTKIPPQRKALPNAPPLLKGEERKKNPLESINHLKSELRELFAQMKQQTEVSEAVPHDAPANSELSRWSTLTDSSDGYNSITEHDLSDLT